MLTEKAIIHAHNDRTYAGLLTNFKGIIFLATPHRGVDLAEKLSTFLNIIFQGRLYVNQIRQHCETVMEINHALVDRAMELEVISFYESRETHPVGVSPGLFCE